ncbi:hypothetical protein BJ944DRAFT_204448 [Cunninghamella echinulata]|nr:hypothetical protein BJ944DRAFT_204448 [Cunninghamella echinulata]
MGDRMAIDEEPKISIRGRGGHSNGRDRMALDNSLEPERSIEGWIIIVRGIHEEADEDSITEKFSEFGNIKNINLNLDRRTGYVKGYALIEYETRREAQLAIDDVNDTKFLGQNLKVDFAFVKGTPKREDRRRSNRNRSLSPS